MPSFAWGKQLWCPNWMPPYFLGTFQYELLHMRQLVKRPSGNGDGSKPELCLRNQHKRKRRQLTLYSYLSQVHYGVDTHSKIIIIKTKIHKTVTWNKISDIWILVTLKLIIWKKIAHLPFLCCPLWNHLSLLNFRNKTRITFAHLFNP